MEINLNDDAKEAVKNLGDAINSAIGESNRVAEAIEKLREIGYEPNLSLKLEIGLYQLVRSENAEQKQFELELTEDDLKTLQSMKIRFE